MALVGGWNHDYWADFDHDGPRMTEANPGLNHDRLFLMGGWISSPSSIAIEAKLSFLLKDFLRHAEGHDELHFHAAPNECQWCEMISQSATVEDRHLAEKNVADRPLHDDRW